MRLHEKLDALRDRDLAGLMQQQIALMEEIRTARRP
jgi:hypothetical protein